MAKKRGTGLKVAGGVLVALAVAITGAGTYFGGVLDTYAGMGEERTVQKP